MTALDPDRTALLRVAERLCDVAVELNRRALIVRSAATTMRWESAGATAFRGDVDAVTSALRTVADQFLADADRLRVLYVSLTQSAPLLPTMGTK